MRWVSAIIIALASYLFIANHFGEFLEMLGMRDTKGASRHSLSLDQEPRVRELRQMLASSGSIHPNEASGMGSSPGQEIR